MQGEHDSIESKLTLLWQHEALYRWSDGYTI